MPERRGSIPCRERHHHSMLYRSSMHPGRPEGLVNIVVAEGGKSTHCDGVFDVAEPSYEQICPG